MAEPREDAVLETPRLRVRRFREADAEALAPILADPEVMRFLEPPFTPERTRAFLREAGLCQPPRVYAVIEKESGTLIGHLIWHAWDETAMELGWVLRRDRWGRGFARELTEEVLARCDRPVMLACCPEQTATRRLAEHFGFAPLAESGELCVYRRALRG